MQSKPEVCICAAIKTKEGKLIRGQRHPDCRVSAVNYGLTPSQALADEGFITSENRYVDRKEGLQLQKAAKIKSAYKDGYASELRSEDLY